MEMNGKMDNGSANRQKKALRNKKIILNTTDCMYFVNSNEIIRCEAEGNYTCFYLLSGEKIIVSKTLKDFEDLLCPLGFYRIHQSHLINIQYLEKFEKKNGGTIQMKDRSAIPISQRRKKDFLEVVASFV